MDKIYKQNVFTWGARNLVKQSDSRTRYLEALREADKNNFDDILKFARS